MTDASGAPVVGSEAVSIYDKAVEYISGGSNVEEIKAFFWKWRRIIPPQTESSLDREGTPIYRSGEVTMGMLGDFGDVGAWEHGWGMARGGRDRYLTWNVFNIRDQTVAAETAAPAPMAAMPVPPGSIGGFVNVNTASEQQLKSADGHADASGLAGAPDVQPTVRKTSPTLRCG